MAQWIASKYVRKRSKTFRDGNTGAVFDRSGKFIGFEITGRHIFGRDVGIKQAGLNKIKKGQKRPKKFNVSKAKF